MKLCTLAVAAIFAASGAAAGGYTAPGFGPVAAGPMGSASAGTDWSGFYAGLQYGEGSGDLTLDGPLGDADFDAYGLHVGYQRDMGRVVLGGDLDYNSVDFEGADENGDLLRLRARVGYDAGRVMPYLTLGVAGVHGDIAGDRLADTGLTYGIGADVLVTDRLTVGVEYTRNTFKDILDDLSGISGLDLDTDLVQVRASYRF
ncbi:porin family protein [Paracoccus liaowanqingii]|uniref:Porin family protein n=1 Tax=Paracoccus liaowanqingii TaxID=2560053 RepID=A0A4Z1C4D9_9RHOB|nr:porin family protein [Paracoccus liaowanqingii]TGN42748.1 porin family protein [Paracoccus liaowanqingii]